MANMSKKTHKRISKLNKTIHQVYGGYGKTEPFDIYDQMIPESIRRKHEAWLDSIHAKCGTSCIRYRRYMWHW